MKKILSLILFITASATLLHADWTTNYKAALSQAKQQNKLVLLNFTGSDWCPACLLLDKEVFPTASFKEFVSKSFIPVTIDLPQAKKLPAALSQQNDQLQQQFNVYEFPTLLVVSADGKERGRVLGYDPRNGPDSVIKKLKKLTKE